MRSVSALMHRVPGIRTRRFAPVRYEQLAKIGVVLKRGRTCYHLRCGRTVLRVPFAWVEPV